MSLSLSVDVRVLHGIPLHGEIEFNYSKDSEQKTIEEVASYVAQVYANFFSLTNEQRMSLYKEQVCLLPLSVEEIKIMDSYLPKPDEFKTALQQEIVSRLNLARKSWQHSVYVSVGLFRLEGILLKICDSVLKDNLYGCRVFPPLTTTWIDWHPEKIVVSLDFRGDRRVF